MSVPKSFTKQAAKWVKQFNNSKDEEKLGLEHFSIAAYHKTGVFSVVNPAGNVHYTAQGSDAIQQQWHTIRTGFGCVQLANASGHKVVMIADDMLIQSFDHIDMLDKDSNVVMSLNILAEVWKLIDGKWYVMADYVMVKPPAATSDKVPESFTKTASQWVSKFNGAKDKKTLKTKHFSIGSYDKKGVFSVSNPAANGHNTALDLDSIQAQWHYIRNDLGCRQVANPQDHKVTMVGEDTLIQSFGNLDLCGKDGKKVMSINILAEIWKKIDGKWYVMADYVMVKPN